MTHAEFRKMLDKLPPESRSRMLELIHLHHLTNNLTGKRTADPDALDEALSVLNGRHYSTRRRPSARSGRCITVKAKTTHGGKYAREN
jgi:hypothetical protein